MKIKSLVTLGTVLAAACLTLSARTAVAQNRMQIEDAAPFAVAAVGGANYVWFMEADTRIEKGVPVWRFTFNKDLQTVWQVRINAITGAPVKVDFNGTSTVDGPPVTLLRAAGIARAFKPGFVWKVEPGVFNGATEWHAYITGTDNREYEVFVNATTGNVRGLDVRQRGRGGNSQNG